MRQGYYSSNYPRVEALQKTRYAQKETQKPSVTCKSRQNLTFLFAATSSNAERCLDRWYSQQQFHERLLPNGLSSCLPILSNSYLLRGFPNGQLTGKGRQTKLQCLDWQPLKELRSKSWSRCKLRRIISRHSPRLSCNLMLSSLSQTRVFSHSRPPISRMTSSRQKIRIRLRF